MKYSPLWRPLIQKLQTEKVRYKRKGTQMRRRLRTMGVHCVKGHGSAWFKELLRGSKDSVKKVTVYTGKDTPYL